MGSGLPLALVLGAGPSGLTTAWNLAQDGYRVLVLEKEPVYGGQSLTFQRGEYRYDLGPHNIHTRRNSVLGFLKKALGDQLVQHQFFSEIYFQNKRIKYPFFGADLLRSVSTATALACGLSFFLTRVGSVFIPRYQDDGSYETWIVNRFGRRMFDLFFGPYSEKVWKISTKDLSDVIARKRISVTGLIELIHSVIFKTERFHPENPRLVECYYPRSGVGVIADFLAKGILDRGGRILTEANVVRLLLEKDQIHGVVYLDHGQECFIDLRPHGDTPPGQVISTMPINELIKSLEGDVPTAVGSAAAGLDFTAEVFLYLNVRRPQAFGLPLFYFADQEFPFNRCYDVGIFSREMVPTGKNALCFEFSCQESDWLWQLDDAAIFDLCLSPLERHGLLRRDDVEGYHTRRLSHAYPRFRIGYEKKMQTILEYLDQRVTNLMTLGRQGLFSYANVDDAIWMGFEVAKHLRYRDRMPLSIKDLLPEYVST